MESKKMTSKELAVTILLHKQWIKGEGGGRADLTRANLTDADLTDAYLTGANLTDAYLIGADLTGANLTGADLTGADLTRANLTDAYLTGANLTGADLTGANLRRADLTGADLTGASMPSILNFTPNPSLLQEIAEKVLSAPSALNMDRWHTCDTTHCLAGWAVMLHPDGKRLEENSSTYLAGRLLLGDEAAKMFFASNEAAIKWLKEKTGK